MLTITDQEIFNKAWQAFIVENRCASETEARDDCLYHGPNNAKCAIGLCIPDELYDKEFEGFSVSDLEDDPYVPFRFEHEHVASDAQMTLHDNVTDLLGSSNVRDQYELQKTYIEFAKKYGLDIPEG